MKIFRDHQIKKKVMPTHRVDVTTSRKVKYLAVFDGQKDKPVNIISREHLYAICQERGLNAPKGRITELITRTNKTKMPQIEHITGLMLYPFPTTTCDRPVSVKDVEEEIGAKGKETDND